MDHIVVKEHIIHHIHKCGWLSYTQLLRVLAAEGIQVNGFYELKWSAKNLILWEGLSSTVFKALSDLLQEGILEAYPAPMELYRIDEIQLNRPIIFKIPKRKLRHPAMYLTYLRYNPKPTPKVLSFVG
ncbi:hypothetical protein [Paenibacillus polymyxa]|uniref:Uncharacterized protein n=1 Tax=Paenibacillus polymyxa (strain SC2) TaxID=886882 RepID=E3ELE3_PAEPS|nr:hypothetical protein [Paenibacillus polymyxa]ADO59975.1 hypothetical protein PPSC2_28305 [Paenibacillus polymyxa SC2]WPQ59807.1 hypothetical protein SKN87_26320 [Paenibacillus polymyxa]